MTSSSHLHALVGLKVSYWQMINYFVEGDLICCLLIFLITSVSKAHYEKNLVWQMFLWFFWTGVENSSEMNSNEGSKNV